MFKLNRCFKLLRRSIHTSTNRRMDGWLDEDLRHVETPSFIERSVQMTTPLSPVSILYKGKQQDDNHILKSAQFLHSELPVRFARQVRAVGEIAQFSDFLSHAREGYRNGFKMLFDFNEIETSDHEKQFTEMLRHTLIDQDHIIKCLILTLREPKISLAEEIPSQAIFNIVFIRWLRIRMLIAHHLALHDERPNILGIVDKRLKPKDLIQFWEQRMKKATIEKHGKVASIVLAGDVEATFPYMAMPLDFILRELLQHAAEATLDFYCDTHEDHIPCIEVTIGNNCENFTIQITDRGGGVQAISMNYPITTKSSIIDISETSKGPSFQDLGLTISRAFAASLGGSLTFNSIPKYGTNFTLRLPHLHTGNVFI